jgi:hypothetical protein
MKQSWFQVVQLRSREGNRRNRIFRLITRNQKDHIYAQLVYMHNLSKKTRKDSRWRIYLPMTEPARWRKAAGVEASHCRLGPAEVLALGREGGPSSRVSGVAASLDVGASKSCVVRGSHRRWAAWTLKSEQIALWSGNKKTSINTFDIGVQYEFEV